MYVDWVRLVRVVLMDGSEVYDVELGGKRYEPTRIACYSPLNASQLVEAIMEFSAGVVEKDEITVRG